MTLYCNTTGNPPPEVAWIRSGEVLVKDNVNAISAINRSLSGIFKCMAWNGISNNFTANCTVDVHCKLISHVHFECTIVEGTFLHSWIINPNRNPLCELISR